MDDNFTILLQAVLKDREHLYHQYQEGMKLLKKHHEETMRRVMKGQKAGKGNFGFIAGDTQFLRERQIGEYLQFILWQMYCLLDGRENDKGLDDELCFFCIYKRYRFHSNKVKDHWNNESPEGWFCQEECEHK
jgi:hypothetical protein